jgi:hypothetical protein
MGSHPTILSLVPRKNQKETSKAPKFFFEKNLKKHVLKNTFKMFFFFQHQKIPALGIFFKIEKK